MLTVARAIGWAADWHTMESRPTLARLRAVSGLSLRSVQRWCRWLEGRGLIYCLEPGTTPQFRPGAWAADGHNLARTWILLAGPPADGTVTPPLSGFEDGKSSTPQPRFSQPKAKTITEKGRAAEVRKFRTALWTAADIDFAASHTPEGTPWAMDDPVRHPRAHLRWRLSWWTGPDGAPLPSRSQRLAAAHVAVLADQARRRAERRQPSGYAEGAALARAMLAQALSQDCETTPGKSSTLPV